MPLWLQLKHALRDLVTFHLQPGARIPTELEICDAYGLSRVTVRQAISALVDEGILSRQRGRGTFVRPARLVEPLGDGEHFLASSFDSRPGGRITLHGAETIPAADWIASRLGLEPGGEVHKLRKILESDGSRVAFRTTYVPAMLAPTLLRQDLVRPLYATLEEVYALAAFDCDEWFEFIIADDWRAEILNLPINHPLIMAERLVRLADGRPLYYSRTFYRADAFRFARRFGRRVEGEAEAVQAG